MIPFDLLLRHSLLYGAILSAALTALIVGSLIWRPMIWIGDAPPDVQAAAPPMSASDRRFKRIAGLAMIGLMLGLVAMALAGLREMSGGMLTFFDAFLTTFIVFETFNLVDLLIIDWLLIEWRQPRLFAVPGMDGTVLTVGYGHHFRDFLKGTAGGVVMSLVVAAVAVVIV